MRTKQVVMRSDEGMAKQTKAFYMPINFQALSLRDLKLLLWLNCILPSFGLLRSVSWFKTDVSRLPIGTLFKGWPLKIGSIGSPETSVLNQLYAA